MNHRLMDLKHIIQITVATVIEFVSIRRASHKEEILWFRLLLVKKARVKQR